MHSRLLQMFALLVVGVAAPRLHAGTVTFVYTAPNVGSTAVSGMGSFSYNGSPASITQGLLTSFAFELDLSTPGALVNPATFDFGLPDLMSFSASTRHLPILRGALDSVVNVLSSTFPNAAVICGANAMRATWSYILTG